MTDREKVLVEAMRILLSAQLPQLPEAYRNARVALKAYAAYPELCLSPEKCAGKGSCGREWVCNE